MQERAINNEESATDKLKKNRVFELASRFLPVEEMEREGLDPLWKEVAKEKRELVDIPFNKQIGFHYSATPLPIFGRQVLLKNKHGRRCAIPKTVRYARAPLSQDPVIEEIAKKDVGKKIVHGKFTWSERMYTHPAVCPHFKKIFNETMRECESKNSYPIMTFDVRCHYHELSSPDSYSASLVIGKIDDTVGHGLFTTRFIPFNTLITLYTGELSCDSPYKTQCDDYQFEWNKKDEENKEACQLFASENEHTHITALHFGNHARFIQHAPHESKLSRYEFYNSDNVPDPTIAKKIATMNVYLKQSLFYNIPVIQVRALKDIPAKHPIYVDYDDGYWGYREKLFNHTPCFFNLDGTVNTNRYEKKTLPNDHSQHAEAECSDQNEKYKGRI